jgi:hypothetical protein
MITVNNYSGEVCQEILFMAICNQITCRECLACLFFLFLLGCAAKHSYTLALNAAVNLPPRSNNHSLQLYELKVLRIEQP